MNPCDPDKLLDELRALLKEMRGQETSMNLISYQNWLTDSGIAERIASVIEHLDAHLSDGGALPSAWLPAKFAKRKLMLTCSVCGMQFAHGSEHTCGRLGI